MTVRQFNIITPYLSQKNSYVFKQLFDISVYSKPLSVFYNSCSFKSANNQYFAQRQKSNLKYYKRKSHCGLRNDLMIG